MPIKQVFESKEDAPEFLRDSLLEQDGKFVFEAELPTKTAGIKSALQKERDAKAALEKSLKGYEGVDPEEARRLKTEAEKVEADKLKQKGDWETRERQLKDQLAADLGKREQHFQTEQEKWRQREARLLRAIEENLIEAHATTAIVGAKGSPELLLPHVMKAVRVVEENDRFVARVMDGQGNPRIADVKGTPFTISNLIEEFRGNPIFGRAFDASGAGGSGASPNNNNGNKGGMKVISPSDQEAINSNIEAIAKGDIKVIG